MKPLHDDLGFCKSDVEFNVCPNPEVEYANIWKKATRFALSSQGQEQLLQWHEVEATSPSLRPHKTDLSRRWR